MNSLRWVLAGIPVIVLATLGIHRLWSMTADTLPPRDDPADVMSPEMAARFDAFRRDTDEALHLAHDYDCLICDLARTKPKDGAPS